MSGFSHGLTHPDFPVPRRHYGFRNRPDIHLTATQQLDFSRRFRAGARQDLMILLNVRSLQSVYNVARRLGLTANKSTAPKRPHRGPRST